MTDQSRDANKLLEALTTSANRLRQLRTQVEQAETEYASLLAKFLDAAKGNPAQLQFAVIQQGKTIAGGPLRKKPSGFLRQSVVPRQVYRLAKAPAVQIRSAAPTSGSLGTHAFTFATPYSL